MCVYTYVYMCVYICMCIYTYIVIYNVGTTTSSCSFHCGHSINTPRLYISAYLLGVGGDIDSWMQIVPLVQYVGHVHACLQPGIQQIV